MQEKLIELEGGGARILIQWGEGKTLISVSPGGVAVNDVGLDELIATLLRAKGQMSNRRMLGF